MGKITRNMYLAVFIILICLPEFFWKLFGRYADSGNYENRVLASRPVFHAETYESYPSEFEAYFNDRIPFRNELISLNSWVNYSVFKTSVNDNVVLGKEKWLFYDAVSDGNPIGEYEGTSTFSDEEVMEMRENALQVQNRLGDMGIRLAIVIPTNKEVIYSQYMPDRYTCSEISRTDRMIKELRKWGVDIINPKEDLLDLCRQYQLYYPYDTHWNQMGAYVGTCRVLKQWGFETSDLSELTIRSSARSGDDLANMLNLGDTVFNDSAEYNVSETFDRDKVQEMEGLRYFNNPEAPYKNCVFLLGDSYRTAMEPALSMYFSDVYVADHDGYTYSMLEQADPDYLIVEYVERHSDRLAGMEQMVFEQ